MSNIYIQEPATSGKVLLKTTVGDIDIELWSRECPKACRNFIQLCMEGYYNDTIFHRVVPGFIVQGGDPNGDGTGGESIYGEPFRDEFHQRLRYTRRGLIGMANSGKNDNGSQFFFTLAALPELQNENTLFAKVTGNTLYNMLKLEECLVDHNERPLYPQKIIRAEILHNPFSDIVPRKLKQQVDKDDKKRKKRSDKGVKNFKLLSFGEEAAEDEEETNEFVQKNVGKAKSMHDVVNDPSLSKDTVKPATDESHDEELPEDGAISAQHEQDSEVRLKAVQEKLKSKLSNNKKDERKRPAVKERSVSPPVKKSTKEKSSQQKSDSESDEDVLHTIEKEKQKKNLARKQEIRSQINSLKREYQETKKAREELQQGKEQAKDDKSEKSKFLETDNDYVREYIKVKKTFTERKQQLPKKGAERESFTLNLLSKFRAKLEAINQTVPDTPKDANDEIVEKEIETDAWLAHTLRFEEAAPVLAKDASTKGDDWYEIDDPRHPLNKRKRGADTRNTKKHDRVNHKR